MAAITAQLVKELREKTGVGMMDCKTALTENNGDFEAAVDWLRAKGLAKAAKKAGRIAADGLVVVASDGKQGAVAEINSETDFVARNPEFQRLVADVGQLALKAGGDLEKLLDAPYPKQKKPVSEVVKELVVTIGENLNVRRTAHLKVKEGAVASYVHSQVEKDMGKIGVLVALESAAPAAKLEEIGRKVAMHIAATNPLSLTPEDIAKDVVERERAIFAEQAKESGKPANIIEKMVEGRMKKFYQEVVLLQQAFVINPDITVEQAVKEAEKAAGKPIKVTGFVRFALGEGIQKKEDDFAAEVAAAAGGGAPAKSEPKSEPKSGAKPAAKSETAPRAAKPSAKAEADKPAKKAAAAEKKPEPEEKAASTKKPEPAKKAATKAAPEKKPAAAKSNGAAAKSSGDKKPAAKGKKS